VDIADFVLATLFGLIIASIVGQTPPSVPAAPGKRPLRQRDV
jgi:hypothetical protein